MNKAVGSRPVLLVLASTYPRWVDDSEPGFVHELCRRLVSEFDVVVVCPHAAGARLREHMDGVEVHRYRYAPARWERLVNDGGIVGNLRKHPWMLALVPGFVLMQAWHAWRLQRSRPVSVIHAHWLIPQGLIAMLLKVFAQSTMPYVVTSHGADLYALRGSVLNAIKRAVVRGASRASVVSSAMKHKMADIGIDTNNVSVLPMGVDLAQRFTIQPSTNRSADELLFVGRLVEKKGLAHLIKAMPQVLASRPAVKLTIAGFGPEAEPLARQVAAAGLSAHVRFLGALPQVELPALYRRAAVFAAPFVKAASGDQEGLPVALMEAIGCGCPIVAGNVEGLEDLFGTETDAVTVDPRDHARLAACIVNALAEPATTQARALRIRHHAVERLEWSRVADSYASLLMSALDDPDALATGGAEGRTRER